MSMPNRHQYNTQAHPYTVRDLITVLQRMPQDNLVEIATEQDGDDIYINSVSVQGDAVILNCCTED